MPSGLTQAKRGPGAGSRRGFSLIEMLVVVVIVALISSIALPGFVRSMKGAELRTAARTVLMAHKYARSTAVLRQTQMAVLIDRESMELEVIMLADTAAADDRDKFLELRTTRDVDSALGADKAAAAPEPDAPPPQITSELVRKLGREISVESFRSELGGQEYEGVYWILYYPNGMSDGFELVLSDKGSRRVEVKSDPISGKTNAEFENF